MSENQENEDEDTEIILSLCWDHSILAAVYYDLTTLQLHMMNETTDIRPDHIQLRNLFRQLAPSFLVGSGANAFLEELVNLLDLPSDTDVSKFKVSKTKTSNANASNVSFFPFNRKTQQEEYRKRIYQLDFPGLPAESSHNDKKIFIDSLLPMNQELVVIAMGNLLKYLNDNSLKWRHAFLNLDSNPIVTNLIVLHMESQVLLDDTTFNALNIFSNVYHPSSFKNQVRRDGLSLFKMLNQCSSSVGIQELKSVLKQPSRNIHELNRRFATIEWCLVKENFDNVIKLRDSLKSILNISAVVGRIITNLGRTSDWKSLKKTVYSCFLICEFCAALDENSVKLTVLYDLGKFSTDDIIIKGILFALDKIVDLDSIEKKKRFIVKEGIDPALDEKREILHDLKHSYNEMTPDDSLISRSDERNAFHFVHFKELGFVIGTEKNVEQMKLDSMESEGIELVLQTVDTTYFRTPKCKQLNDEFERQMSEIIQHEMRIFGRLVAHINENLAELIDITKLCAKLDVLISFASVSATFNFTKPKISKKKELIIVNGRHPLVEQIKDFVPSTTIITEENRNFINIINAPNASGKSVYMKKVALICYMAHIGMFVPADDCTVMLLDSIYTRIHTPESIYQCESAFMADLQQMSKVVMNSSCRSLVLVDEFGKGTHYKDGIALLAASIEHFVDRGNLTPLAFITTHYQQVYEILQSKDFTNLKTIVTRQNESGIFESAYEIADGTSGQNFFTEFPESKKILGNIFDKKDR